MNKLNIGQEQTGSASSEMEIVRRNQKEMLDIKNIIEEIQNAFDELISCLDMTKGRVCVSGYVDRNF